uniref:Uncharacterized protein n=1 Tax=Rhizophora mucronata TaxID=61149 RepID=A0A2P2JJ63_RHIMU
MIYGAEELNVNFSVMVRLFNCDLKVTSLNCVNNLLQKIKILPHTSDPLHICIKANYWNPKMTMRVFQIQLLSL